MNIIIIIKIIVIQVNIMKVCVVIFISMNIA